MPSVLGQVGQDVADNLFELGKGAVVGTAKAATDIASETIEQVTSVPNQAAAQNAPKKEGGEVTGGGEEKKIAEKQQYERVKAELETYRQRREKLNREIVEEKAAEGQQVQQKKAVEKNKHDSWVSRIINRAQTGTEKGRSTE